MEFNYPIDYTLYNVDEITLIIKFLDTVEKCYTKGVELEEYKALYREFKTIVTSKSEENNMLKEYKELTGYDGYLTTKEMKNNVKIIKLKSK